MKVRRATLGNVAAAIALAYFVILGEAGQLEAHPILRILNAAAAGTLIVTYLLTAPRRADRVDRGLLLVLLLIAAASVLAQFPRQAFDALLAALLFTAALFVARTLLAEEAARVVFVRCLIGLSALLTFVVASRWLLPALEWWSLTGWRVIPPLDLNLPAWPWGHRHDLTLLIVMLYPSWWIGRVGPLRAAIATVVGIITLLIVLVDGSRAVWLGMAVASAALLVPFAMRHGPKDRRRQVGIGVALVVGVAALAFSGISGSVVERLLRAESIETRWAMWGPLTEAWLAKPIAGYGPGSFAWVLQVTDYFDTNGLAPRHPDSVIFQLLPEAGLLGVAAVIIVVAAVLPRLVRGRSRAALWALITFALAGLGASPTDFGFLVAVAIGWVAFTIPHEVESPVVAPVGRRFVTLSSLACFAVVAVTWTATSVADLSYLSARSEIGDGRLVEAIPRLELARNLDPGMALYARQLGTAQFQTGEIRAAIHNLEDAAQMNPSDDLAWRVLALARASSGDSDSAWTALDQAIETQRSDPTNLLLRARWQVEAGDREDALATLGEVVQAWPEIVAAPGWSQLLPPTVSTLDVIQVAVDRWSRDLPSPEPRDLQPVLLTVMAGNSHLAQPLADEALGPSMGAAYVAVMGCERSASAYLQEAPDQARRTALYWSLVSRQSVLDGELDYRAARLVEIMTNGAQVTSPADATLNPLDENGSARYSADMWGYRRAPTTWPTFQPLPSVWAGETRWYVEPREAVRAAGLDMVLGACR